MTRYDWSKLDAGWYLQHGHEGVVLHSEKHGFGSLVSDIEILVVPGPRYAPFVDQLAKCRIRDTEPAPSERTTPTNAELMAQLERMQSDVDVMRAELAEMRNPTDERDWQALTEENERLREQVRRLQDSDCFRAFADEPDWRDEVRQACDGVDGIREPYIRYGYELVVRPTVSNNHEAFQLILRPSREYMLVDGVRTIEGALRLSLIIERLKKLGWREAE